MRDAAELLPRRGEVAAFDPNRLAVEEGVRDLLASRLEDAVEGRTRDAHLLCAFLLLEPFQILQADGFHLLYCQSDLGK
jgi:hypothetical protein